MAHPDRAVGRAKIANFSGMYTYDAIAGATAPGWANAGAYAKAHGLIWAPSVGPGYIDDQAVPEGNWVRALLFMSVRS